MSDSFKASVRVPTGVDFAYLEIQVEGTPSAIIEAYDTFTRLVKVGAGLENKEWNEALDRYMDGKGMAPDIHEKMNKAQQWLIHEIDKSKGRLAPKIPAKKRTFTKEEETEANRLVSEKD